MSSVEPIKDPNAVQKFDNLWSDLISIPEVLNYTLRGVQMSEALKLGRMTYSLTGTPLRGLRLAGVYQRQYILVFGEYGHLVLEYIPDQGIIFAKSQSYHFYDQLSEPTARMDELVKAALLAGLRVSSLLQWYDSVYRRQTGRHVSPHFDPVKSLDKSSAAIIPGLYALEHIRNPSVHEVSHVGNVRSC